MDLPCSLQVLVAWRWESSSKWIQIYRGFLIQHYLSQEALKEGGFPLSILQSFSDTSDAEMLPGALLTSCPQARFPLPILLKSLLNSATAEHLWGQARERPPGHCRVDLLYSRWCWLHALCKDECWWALTLWSMR